MEKIPKPVKVNPTQTVTKFTMILPTQESASEQTLMLDSRLTDIRRMTRN